MDSLLTRASARVELRADGDISSTSARVATRPSGIWPLVSTLGDFARAGLRPSTPLQRGIAAALAIKLLVIIALRVFVFTDGTRVIPTDHAVARVIGVERR